MSRENSKFDESLARLENALHEELCKFMIISRKILLRMRCISDKICRENQNISC